MISGKPREQCIAAIRAARGSPDIAFELLMSGAPLGGAGGVGAEGGEDYGDEEGSEPMEGNPFAALASNPNF